MINVGTAANRALLGSDALRWAVTASGSGGVTVDLNELGVVDVIAECFLDRAYVGVQAIASELNRVATRWRRSSMKAIAYSLSRSPTR